MKKIALLFTLLPLLALNAFGQQRNIEFTKYELDNGLDVILHEDHSTPIVTVSVMYHVGSKNENPDRTGFAHFFEHLMFEGSENIERGEFMNIVQNAGGQLNANTSQDRTYYYETLPSNQLELGLWLESERMLHAKVDTTGVETQREVVKEERRQRYDNQPYSSFIEEVFKRAYKDHPYEWTPIGTMEDLNAAQIDEFRNFYATYYVPNNASLVIAGDIDPKKTKKLVDQYFSEIPSGDEEIARKFKDPEPLNGPMQDTVYDNIQLPAIFQCYRIPARNTDDYYAMDMLTTLLSDGESSRLNKTLVDQKQLALTVGAFPFALEEGGLFVLFGLPNSGLPLDTLQEGITTELDRVKNEKISEREFQKLRNQVKSDFVSSNSSMSGIASSLATYNVLLDDPKLINSEINRYMKVTREDIMRVANEYLTPDNRIRLYYLPKDSE